MCFTFCLVLKKKEKKFSKFGERRFFLRVAHLSHVATSEVISE